MPTLRSRLGLSAFVFIFAACTSLDQTDQPPQRTLAQNIDALLNTPALENAIWGIQIIDLETDSVLYTRNARTSFVPASNLKLYTTASALDQLGPSFQYETEVLIDGTVVDSVLHGNLVVRGSGDPSIGGRFHDGDLTFTFRAWADTLHMLGIRQIQGNIIGDDDVFDDIPLGTGWSWDDLTYWYAAELGGLVFNDNCVDIAIEGTRVDTPGQVTWEPALTDYVHFINETRTVDADKSIDEGYERRPGSNTIRLFSQVPAGQTDRESLSVHNPTLYFAHVLRETLIKSGIQVHGQAVDIDDRLVKPDSASLRKVALHRSPPLSELVKVVNKRSHNLYADQLLKTLAVHSDPDSVIVGSHEAGVEAAMKTFAAARVDTSRIRMIDGSGLSHMNLVTPEMTVRLLAYMWSHPDRAAYTAFNESLPIGGLDGTLEYRFDTGPARRNVRAKTGYISGARTLSGYVTSGNGRELAFSLMCNHYTVPTREVNQLQDALVNLLAGLHIGAAR